MPAGTGYDRRSINRVNQDPKDHYPSPPLAVFGFLVSDDLSRWSHVWEPACGSGDISEILSEVGGLSVFSTDLYDYGYREQEAKINFLDLDEIPAPFTSIITNPPYEQTVIYPFFDQVIEWFRNGSLSRIALLMRTQYLEGQKRTGYFKRMGLYSVHHFSFRLKFKLPSGGISSQVAYSWYVFNGIPRESYTGHFITKEDIYKRYPQSLIEPYEEAYYEG